MASDPPPSYSSLYGRLQTAKTESSGSADYFKRMSTILNGSIGCTICLGLLLVFPIISIIIGAIHVNNCPQQRYIPIYVIVAGSVGFVLNFSNLIYRCRNAMKKEGEKLQTNPLEGILMVFIFGWFIAGNVWVYGTHGKFTTEDPSAADYCHPTIFWYAFVLITLCYIIFGLTCCCFCCLGCFVLNLKDDKAECDEVNQAECDAVNQAEMGGKF